MTYCIGLIYQGSVFLLGDSAVTTFTAMVSNTISSFGETTRTDRSVHVSEGALKIAQLAPNCAIAIAGDSTRAYEGIEILRSAYSESQSIPELLTALSNSISNDSTREFRYLIGRVGDAGPELWCWSSANQTSAERVDCMAQIGSLETWHGGATALVVKLITENGLPEDRLLSVVAAIVQSYGLRDVLFAHGVGGVVSGLRLSRDGDTWLSDTNYVIHDREFSSFEFVSVCCRDGVVATRSSYTHETRLFFSAKSSAEIDTWVEEWRTEIGDRFDTGLANMWVFLSREMLSTFIIASDLPIASTPGFALTRLAEGKYDLAIDSTFKAALLSPVVGDPGDGSIPLRISYVQAERVMEQAAGILGGHWIRHPSAQSSIEIVPDNSEA